MPKYTYTALSADNKTLSGTLEAEDRAAVLAALAKQKVKPVSIHEEIEGTKGLNLNPFGGGAKVKSKDLVIFTRQLSTMVSAGVPLLRALTTLQTQSESKGLKVVLGVINKDVQGGMSLGDAFAKHPNVFSDIYVNMVRAGEAGGILDDILKRLAVQQEKNDTMKHKIKGAMTYPMVLISITFIAFFGLMLFVVPQIGKIIKDVGGPDAELPALTQVMLSVSEFMQNQWYIIVAVVIGGIFLFKRYIKTPKGKSQFHHIVIRIPTIGGVVRKVAVARFSRTFASMMGAGVNVLEALKVTGRAIGNAAYQEEIEKAAEAVKNGKPLSEALSGSKLFPGIIPQMLAVGEETGETATVLIKVADFYEEEVDTTIDSLSSILEPVMIVIMGTMVGLIAASVIGPISNLSQTAGG